MQSEIKAQLSTILKHLSDALDIPPEIRNHVIAHYHDVAKHLSAEDSPLRSASPELYGHGSFELGTVTLPVREEDEIDIDQVCLLQLKKEGISQVELKKRIGDRLAARPDLKKILVECRRCWRLDFPEGFHMDILPAIPDFTPRIRRDRILITDTELRLWQHSNPKGYARWFREQMAIAIEREKQWLMEASAYRMSIADIPDYQVKTPLQRAVQILKRHRDIYFGGDPDNRPVSIILTTLAARAYSDEDNLLDALLAITRNMPNYIERRDGKWRVENPVNPLENFADKWNEYPERREAFMAWLDQVEVDFEQILKQRGNAVYDSLKSAFGNHAVIRAVSQLGNNFQNQSSNGHLQMKPRTGHIVTPAASTLVGAVTIPKHTFYGRLPKTQAD